MGNNRTTGTDTLYFYGLLPPPNVQLAWNGSYLNVSWNEIYTPDVKVEIWQSINGGAYEFAGISDFQNFNESQQYNDRTVLGALPDITFLHLAAGSDLINTGVDVGLPFSGAAPDLGCFETP